ncbi:phenoloxidase-activating factor 3 [Bicyclus anynana]|uniref:Phenoloxidase-activating factor 3 n=1 Tax=Bicyclus anynana TaxID=110368 RepID=A0ABM3LMZ4_BICAN|nr:phenoloxidase-activating factor 3 [Bicyclus anynana]
MAETLDDLDGGLEFRCGGSIINSRYILTAAHCVIHNGAFKNIAGVRIGELDYSTDVDCQGHGANMKCETRIQDMHVEEIIPHEKFNEQHPVTADLALLRLSAPIVMHDNAAPICLPVHEELRAVNLTDRSATVAGWGVAENRPDSSRLMKDQITIKSGDICNSYYNVHENQTHFEKAFCAGTMNKDSCIGNSGGPLMVEADYNGSKRFVQYGIASLGLRPCGSQSPAIYTDVSKHMDWILDHIKE